MPHPVSVLRGALSLACAFACAGAFAQSALQPDSAASAAERAQRETDRTMYWIRVLATKPSPAKPAPAPAPAPKTAAVAAPAAAKPAAEPREKAKAVAAPTTVAAAHVAPGPQVGRDPNAPQSPVSDAPEPSALSSRGADNAVAAAATPPMEVAASPPAEPDPGLIQVKSVQPDFPGNVVKRVRKGHVEVRFEVDPGGTVVDADVIETSNAHLNSAALDAVKQWRFKPTPSGHTAAVNLVFDIDKEK